MTDLLFIYGTLLQPGNSFADYLQQNCTYLFPGKLRGLLYDIGEYPGAIVTDDSEGYIHGSIIKLHHPKENLRVIDDYEGYGPAQSHPNLYNRYVMPIKTDNGFNNAWIYLYNLPTDGLPQITSGNYAEYVRQKKSPGS